MVSSVYPQTQSPNTRARRKEYYRPPEAKGFEEMTVNPATPHIDIVTLEKAGHLVGSRWLLGSGTAGSTTYAREWKAALEIYGG